jgi:hypothetical protein
MGGQVWELKFFQSFTRRSALIFKRRLLENWNEFHLIRLCRLCVWQTCRFKGKTAINVIQVYWFYSVLYICLKLYCVKTQDRRSQYCDLLCIHSLDQTLLSLVSGAWHFLQKWIVVVLKKAVYIMSRRVCKSLVKWKACCSHLAGV